MKKHSSLYALISLSLIGMLSSCSFQQKTEMKVKAASVEFNGYYDEIENDPSLTGGESGTLRKKLTTLIKPAAYYKYSGSSKGQLGYELQAADEDPNNSENMIMFYTQNSIPKIPGSSSGTTNWTREHVWCQSNSNGLYGETGAGADILHIRPAYQSVNSSRGNHKYAEVAKIPANQKTYEGMTWGYMANNYFMPIDEIKGDVARTCLYLWTTYFCNWKSESDPTPLTYNFDKVSTAIKWHLQDAPSALEVNRNNVAQNGKQQNRNPFVDHPEYACRIWGNYDDETRSLCESQITITIKNTPEKINIKQQIQLEVQTSTGVTPTFTSSDPSVATVSETGLLTGIKTGNCEIIVSVGEVKTSFPLSVTTIVDPGGIDYMKVIILSTTIPLGIIIVGTIGFVIVLNQKKKHRKNEGQK